MKVIEALLMGLLMLASTTASAASACLGFGIGQTFVDQGVFGEMDTGYKLFGGAQFHPNLP
ncbi:hypothetical protein [Kaarinaea lacus]